MRLRHGFLAALAAVAAALPANAGDDGPGDLIFAIRSDDYFHYHVFGMPDFDQRREASGDGEVAGLPNGGRMYCGPTAAMNLVVWLANTAAPDMPPGADDWHHYTGRQLTTVDRERYNHATQVIRDLGALMSTSPSNGTLINFLHYGLYRHFIPHADEIPYSIYQYGIDSSVWVSPPCHRRVQFHDVERILRQGAVGLVLVGYYPLGQDGEGDYTLGERDGGHFMTIATMDRVGLDERRIGFSNPGSGDPTDEEAHFAVDEYSIEPLYFQFQWHGELITIRRWVLLRSGETLASVVGNKVKIIERFEFLRPSHMISYGVTSGITINRTRGGALTGPHQVDFPVGEIVVGAALSPGQQHALALTRNDPNGNGRVLRIDVETDAFDAFAETSDPVEIVSTRFGTAVVLDVLGANVRHLSPFDDVAAESQVGQHAYDGVATEMAVHDGTDLVWLFDPAGRVSSLPLPDLDDQQDLFLPPDDWTGVTDFEVDPGEDLVFWFARDGYVVRVVPGKPGSIDVLVPPEEVESVRVHASGIITTTSFVAGQRRLRRFRPDFDEGTLLPVPSVFDDLAVQGEVQITRSRTNLDPLLDLLPESVNLDVDLIADSFPEPSPPAAGLICEATDAFDDLVEDDVPVTSRAIDGVTVSMSTATGAPIFARTYGDEGLRTFAGAEADQNRPFAPFQVSAPRFVSASIAAGSLELFHDHQPIAFDFDAPVRGFGLSTLDLMEVFEADESLRLVAFDANGAEVARHERFGAQGPSGLVLRWFVETEHAVITRVELSATPGAGGGYGLDDLEICRAHCLGDVNGDGAVGLPDLLAVLSAWGPCASCPADVDGDGTVGFLDLTTLLSTWGPCP